MDKIKSILKKCNSGIPFGIGLLAVGLLLLLLPGSSLKTFCFLIGVALAVKWIIGLIDYIEKKEIHRATTGDLVSTILTFFAAFIFMVHPVKLLSVIPVVVGIGVVIYGIVSILKLGKSIVSKIIGAVTIVVGIAIISSPFAFAEALTSILGIALIIVGIVVIINSKKLKLLKDNITEEINKDENGYTEVEFTDVDE